MRSTPLRVAALALLAAAVSAAGCGPRAAAPPPVQIPVLEPPLNDAALDEELVMRRGTEEWRYRVVSAGDVEVVVEVVKSEAGAPQAPQRFQWHRNGFGLPPNAVIRRIEPGHLELGGESWDCWVLHVSTRAAGQFYYWLSTEVGVHGLLKIARSEGGTPDEAHAITRVTDSVSGRSGR